MIFLGLCPGIFFGTAAEGESKIRNIATGWIKTSGVNIENMGLSRRA